MNEDQTKVQYRMRTAAMLALVMVSVFLIVATMYVLKSSAYVGSGVAASNTISVTGEGEVFAVPDIATFSVTIQETAKDVKTAQDSATAKANDIIKYLKDAGIADKDVQTSDYSIQPQYEWQDGVCTAGSVCRPGKQTLTGYQVSQTLSVKVRDTSKAGDILAGVGSRGASQVSGLSFTIDDQDTINAQARDKAIAQAEDKAQVLAKSLHVSLVRVVGFSENTGGYPIPYAAKSMAYDSAGGMGGAAPQIPTGENKVTSNVTVTYEIR